MHIEYADMSMRGEPRSPAETYKELEALWIRQGRRTVPTPRPTQLSRTVAAPKPKIGTATRQQQVVLDLKRKRLALLAVS